jgi:hypothetical protein
VGSAGSILFAFIENGLAFVVFVAITFSLLIAFVLLAPRRGESAYDRIGAGGMTKESDYDGDQPQAGESAAERAERQREIRQMLLARSERLVRGGQPALDVDAEVARLLAASPAEERDASPSTSSREHDPELLAEVRQLVTARNERRERQGQEPLDVDGEIARTLEELEP